MSGVDSFGLLYGNGRRRDSVLPPFSCHSRILDLLPPRTPAPSPSIPEQCDGLRPPSKLTAFVSRVKNALSGTAEREELPEIVPCIARPSSESLMRPRELPSKVPLASMPSEGLVVIQIIRSNHQQHGSGEPLLLQGQSKNPFSISKTAGSSRIKELRYDGEKVETKKSPTLDESQVQGLEPTDTRKESGEVNRSALDGITGGDIVDDGKRDGQEHNICFALDEDVGTAGHNIGGGTIHDSEEDEKEWRDTSRFNTLPKKESAASQIDSGRKVNEGKNHKKDRGVSSRFGDLSNEESVASHIEDGSTANENEEDGRERGDVSRSLASSEKNQVDLRSKDSGTEYVIEREESNNGDISMSKELYVNDTAVSQPIVGDGSANGIKGKEKNREGRPISESLPSRDALHGSGEDYKADKDRKVGKEYRDISNIEALSDESSDDESDGGVAIGNFQDGWEYGSTSRRPHGLSNEDNAEEGDENNALEDTEE